MTAPPDRCGRLMRPYEKPGWPVFEPQPCGRRAGHPGRHISVVAIRRAPRQAPSGDPEAGEAIREARARAGMTQRRLAALTGVTQAAVEHWEHGRRTPVAENWVQLELALGPLGVVREAAPETAATEAGRAA
jgi:ribosome-binding protein aMBF1 (putative translation factor)